MKIEVHTFSMGDVEDPQLYAAGPIIDWENSEPGKWVKANALDQPCWFTGPDPFNYGYRVRIVADLRDEDVTYFNLKWGNRK
jgi:hypothetical protein